ncbi:hypothetical protein RHMOL_Rhmol12G0195200 [Rhododendron molle]|uniref:Uncharacterized protein n=1 Tax=Rhododendron molle TaxID=49168 RepID=A0ACC0LK06_RHOML|nr:hypothetical protein RHMOL_Rhmol12G0195200 [Rhododendron molle]
MPPLKKTLAQFFRQPPTPTPTLPNSPIEAPNQPPHDLALPIQQPLPLPNALLLDPQNEPSDLVLPIQQPNAQQQQHQNNLDFPTLVVAFCLTGATEIAAQSLQKHTVHPLYFHSLYLMVVVAFASIFVAKYIAPKQPNAARVLNNLGVFFGVTAFFFAVTISFPLCLGSSHGSSM